MSPETKKKDTPRTRNQEQIATLEARLEEMGDQTLSLPILLECVNLTNTIKKLKENPNLTIG